MFGLGIPELIIVFAILLLFFGVGRISKLAGELGSGIRAFKDGFKGKDADDKPDGEKEL
ncbi:MAG: twin-arginine translocase TatA/TatE family subunit [Chloroflexota bacterium]